MAITSILLKKHRKLFDWIVMKFREVLIYVRKTEQNMFDFPDKFDFKTNREYWR
jgi:hypothetical protein